MTGALIVSADGMRVYIRLRRGILGYTQQTFAKAIETPYATYRDYEGGSTHELKAGSFARAVDVLSIPLEHIKRLGKKEVTVEEAERLAGQSINLKAKAVADQVSDYDVDIAVRFIDSLEENPDILARLRQMLKDSGDEDAA